MAAKGKMGNWKVWISAAALVLSLQAQEAKADRYNACGLCPGESNQRCTGTYDSETLAKDVLKRMCNNQEPRSVYNGNRGNGRVNRGDSMPRVHAPNQGVNCIGPAGTCSPNNRYNVD